MNIFSFPHKTLITAAVAAVLLAACTAAPTKPEGAATLRSRLIQLQSNPELASRAPLAIKDADLAVTAAEKPQSDKVIGAHLVFLADRKVSIAQAQAESRLAVDQRKTLGEQREAMRLQARTREADAANARAATAVASAAEQARQAEMARSATADAQRAEGAARDATADAQRNAQELQRQIDDLQAKETERGLVLTLGDVLFATGTATLNTGVSSNLGKLANFLTRYPERTVLIEGYTDSVGTDEYNQGLSERRAQAVKAYLIGQNINAARLTATGKGENSPVGDNGSSTGRQQNRRVEVVIQNQLVSAR